MYTPVAFRETRAEVIESAMAENPLATLVTSGAQGLGVTHIPMLYYPVEDHLGILRGHLAKANPQWREYLESSEALAIFQGPEHYVSPTWYPSTAEHGKAVPTWNYVAVHARGTLTFTDDPEWLLENVRALTDRHEKSNQPAWKVEDAPKDFIDQMLKAIIGVEMTITSLEGKWKVSQNRSLRDREGVVEGLQNLHSPDAEHMAKLVKKSSSERL